MIKLVVEYWTPAIIWLAMMYLFSTDMMSSGETSRFVVPMLTFFFPALSPAQIDLWHGVIRKLAHVTEYFILASLLYRSLTFEHPNRMTAKLRTMTFIVLAALMDELHQSFTASRTASLLDVGYDCLGGVWALWLITMYEVRRLRPRSVL